MSDLTRRCAPLAILALLALLAGCARPTGDFGRVEPDPLHDEAMPVAGDFLAGKTGRPVSAFNLTDQERDMRNRIWRYLVDQHVYEWFGPTVTELQRTRILPLDARPLATDRYYQWLHRQSFASSRVRYAKLSDDAELDTELIAPTFASICAVLDVDRQRGIAADATPGLEESMKANAVARQAENRAQIAWFVRALDNRYANYSYALDHLLVDTPHEEAIRTDGLLSALATEVAAADHGEFCAAAPSVDRPPADAAIRSRVFDSPPAKGS